MEWGMEKQEVRTSLSSTGGDVGFFSGWFYSSWDLLKSPFTNPFILRSANFVTILFFCPPLWMALLTSDSAGEDDEDENTAIQTENNSSHTKTFMLDTRAHGWNGQVWHSERSQALNSQNLLQQVTLLILLYILNMEIRAKAAWWLGELTITRLLKSRNQKLSVWEEITFSQTV